MNRDTIRAAAVIANVNDNGTDAVRVESEHSEDQAIVLLAPFTRTRFRRKLTFGELVLERGEATIRMPD